VPKKDTKVIQPINASFAEVTSSLVGEATSAPELATVDLVEFSMAVGKYGDQAKKGPVVVTMVDNPWVILLSPEEYERLKKLDT
jgi:hypothetical protein